MTSLEILQNFDKNSLPDLDVVILGALELFAEEDVQKINIEFKKPLVLGSEGALATGRIMFHDKQALFASESNYQEVLETSGVDGVVIISASGGKHAKEIADTLQSSDTPVVLITNNPSAPAAEFVTKENIFLLPKNREPYTYNTSTYLGMILAFSESDAGEISKFILEKLDKFILRDLSKYSSYTFILPKEFSLLTEHIRIKFEELFIPQVWGRAYTEEGIKHAKTIVSSDDELFISLGTENKHFGQSQHRLHLPLPDNSTYASTMASAYYIIGRIQAAQTPYFKNNIEKYTVAASRIFGEKISVIVE